MSTTAAAIDVRLHVTAAGPLEVARIGDGPTVVVVVHGIPGSWRQAIPLARDLAPRHTVLLPSRPGYGRTPLATGRSYAQQADAYASLLDLLGAPDAAIIGISGGGPSALAFAERHPGRTRGLVLCCALAPHLLDPPLAMRLAAGTPGAAPVLAAASRWWGRRRLDNPAAVDRAIARGLTPGERTRLDADPRIRSDLVGFLRSHLDAPPGIAGVRNDLEQLLRARAIGAVPAAGVSAPTLVLHGDADTVVPIAHGEHHASLIPGASLEVYDGAGHVFLLTHRHEVSARIAAFLDGVDAHR